MKSAVRGAVNLLNSRGVDFRVLDSKETRDVTALFVEAFIKPEKKQSLFLNIRQTRRKNKQVDYFKYFNLPKDVVSLEAKKVGLFDWVSFEGESSCYLIWSEPSIQAFELHICSLKDIELSSFSDGYFFDENLRRTIVNTRDNDIFLAYGKGGR